MSAYVITNHVVANNPVAKAIAKNKVSKMLLHTKLRIFTMEQGQPCQPLLCDLGFVMGILGMAGELDPAVGHDDPRTRIIRGAMSAINQMVRTGKWDTTQAVSVEQGLVQAEELNKVIKAMYLLDAWEQMPGGAA